MSELMNSLTLSNFFVQFIILIILIGILILEYFGRNRNEKKGILYFIVFVFFIILLNVFETYRIFFGDLEGIAKLLVQIINPFVLLFLIFIAYKLWNKLNKIIFLLIFVNAFILGILIVIGHFFQRDILDAMGGVSIFFSFTPTIWLYFLIINFLIGDSREKIKIIKKSKKKIKLKLLIVVGIMVLIVVAGVFLFLPKQEKQELASELSFYNWNDYISLDVIEGFEKEFGVNVTLHEYSDEAEMISNIKNNPGKYDLVITEDDSIKKLLGLGLLEKIDKGNVKNFENIHDLCKGFSFDLHNDYSIPYQWGTTAFAFNVKYIPEETDSWGIFWDSNYKGKVALMDNPSEIIGVSSKYIGKSLVPQSVSDFTEVKKFVLMQKENLRGYEVAAEIMEDLVSEELWAGQTYSQLGRVIQEENPNIKYIIPKEGAVRWMDSYALVSGSKNKRTAEAFINFVLRPEESAKIITYLKSTNCNKGSWALVSKDLKEINEKINNKEIFKFVEYMSDYGDNEEVNELMLELWKEIKENE